MSTKIYTGVKFASNNIYEIFKSLIDIRKECIEIGMNHLTGNRFGTLRSYMLIEKLFYRRTRDIVFGLQKSFDKTNRPHFHPSFLFNIVIYPHPSGQFYGAYFDDNISEYHKLLFDKKIVTDFHYQNQADRPEDISEEDWNTRETIWDELLSHGHSFSENGFIFEIVQPAHMHSRDNYVRLYERVRELKQILQNRDSKFYRYMWE